MTLTNVQFNAHLPKNGVRNARYNITYA